LRAGKPTKARDLFISEQTKQTLSGTFAADAEAAIAAGFYYSGEREQSVSLARAAAAANQPLGLWINGLILWEKREYSDAAENFSKLSAHPALTQSGRAAASFWSYRSHKSAGKDKKAASFLEQAAENPRSFYGLLASRLLGKPQFSEMSKNYTAPEWNAEKSKILSSTAAGWRALALTQIGETSLAESELRRINPQGNTALRLAMISLSAAANMPSLEMQLATISGKAVESGFEPALYPLPEWKPEKGFLIDRALLFAVARHESMFDPSAVSAKGAVGLMQLMPSTAKKMAGNSENIDLMDPEHSLSLGQKYIRHLSENPKIGNNLLFILAAYNGGPGKLAKWMKKRDSVIYEQDPLLFMESIPVRETRNYIARVLPHYWAYKARLSQPLTSLADLAEGKWPQIAMNDKEESSTITIASNESFLAAR
jgi:soluble lytic murein transglycosylase-like protein